MHHGYYPKGGAPKSNQQAQLDMIEESLRWAGAEGATKVGHPYRLAVLGVCGAHACSWWHVSVW